MTKKILQVKKNNEEGMQSIGSASGITSMLSRGYQTLNTKRTTFTAQQDSINRLYQKGSNYNILDSVKGEHEEPSEIDMHT